MQVANWTELVQWLGTSLFVALSSISTFPLHTLLSKVRNRSFFRMFCCSVNTVWRSFP